MAINGKPAAIDVVCDARHLGDGQRYFLCPTCSRKADDTTAIAQRDEAQEEAVTSALLAGRSVNAVRKTFGLSLDEIDAIIARTWPVDNRARLRMIMTDLGKLDRLITEFYGRSLISRDATSAAFATVAIKAMERKHDLVGMSAATRVDIVQMQTQEAPSGYEKIKAAILALKYGPGQRPSSDGNRSADPAKSD